MMHSTALAIPICHVISQLFPLFSRNSSANIFLFNLSKLSKLITIVESYFDCAKEFAEGGFERENVIINELRISITSSIKTTTPIKLLNG